MEIQEFEKQLNAIRLANGWKISLNFTGIWEIIIYEKETGRRLGSTGSTGIAGILLALAVPLSNQNIWTN